ncbi:MAG: GAF domain-containing protein [Syntrophobacteraceae bacterium]
METREARFLSVFEQFSKSVTRTLSVEQRLKVLADGIVEAFEVKGCAILLLDEEGHELKSSASCGLSSDYLNKGVVDAKKSMAEALGGRIVIIGDARSDSRVQYPEAAVQEGIVTIVSVPIVVREKTIGVLRVYCAEERTFTPEELQFAVSLAELGGIAFENATLLERAFVELGYLRVLKEGAKALTSSLHVEEILDLIAEKTVENLKVKGCSIRLAKPGSKSLNVVCSKGLSEEYLKKGPVASDQSIAATMTGEVVWVEDARRDARAQYPGAAEKEGIATILSVPILLEEEVIGAVRLYTSSPRRFTDFEIEFVQSMAEFGAIALENARLHRNLQDDYKAVIEDIQLFRGYTAGL